MLQGESLNEHHPAYEYYQKREHRVMDTLTRAVERDGLADPRREARTALSMMNGIRVRLAQGDRKSTRLNSSHIEESRMPSSA